MPGNSGKKRQHTHGVRRCLLERQCVVCLSGQWDDLLIVSSTAFRVTLLLRDEEVFNRLRMDLESAIIVSLYDMFPAPSPWCIVVDLSLFEV